ncbi:MAG: prolyl oligopeptidase family serine peptidase, partial [Planctomycetes bacterium]|nr:prolyl oligopeptidase family serine peptidase [Planctomycetota bacterium]
VRHGEFHSPEEGPGTLDVLDRGLLRASQAARGETPWRNQFGVTVAQAYRSRVDGSVQPYSVTYPADYLKDPRKKWRLDVVLHGRDATLTEVKFLHQHDGRQQAAAAQDYVQLDVYGRGNNGYRWAGETDVWEALNNFLGVEQALGRDGSLDLNRIMLRGFSMGGAGTWQIGLHRPDVWCCLGPGAGFVTTHGFVKDLPEKLPAYQEACLHIYDAADYAENAFNVPVVAYGGSKDPQLQAARTMEERFKPLHIPMTLLEAPGLAHSFPPEWQKKAQQEYAKHGGGDQGNRDYPEHVKYVTYTLRYGNCFWVEVLGLDRHYERALVDARKTEEGFTVKTTNVRALRLGVPAGSPGPLTVDMDGQAVPTRPYLDQNGSLHVYLERRGDRWQAVFPQKLLTNRMRHLQKTAGLQGPIDDAFMDSFLCVRGTGKPWHAATQKYAEANLKRFQQEWNLYLRGDLPVKDDAEVTEDDIARKHLILFGDPSSNSVLGQVVDSLPLEWTRDHITLDDRTYSAAEHVPVLIYPSPLNPNRYVVVNSGHTFHDTEFRGSNALLFPRLGDYAILKLASSDKDPLAVATVTAGLFDDSWK